MCVSLSLSIHIYIYIYTHTHIYIYIYIYGWRSALATSTSCTTRRRPTAPPLRGPLRSGPDPVLKCKCEVLVIFGDGAHHAVSWPEHM